MADRRSCSSGDMSTAPTSSRLNDVDQSGRRRKIRKGTHSCWECRKRKIRCQFASDSDSACIGCRARGSQCRSQEFVDDTAATSPSEGKLTQRLGRLEAMMETLVTRFLPSETSAPPVCPSVAARSSVDVLDSSPATNTPIAAVLGIREALAPISVVQAGPQGDNLPPPRHLRLCQALYALFPAQSDIAAIVKASAGPYFVLSLFHSARELMGAGVDMAAGIAVIPPASSHPSLLARRLLQLAICMQQLSPTFHLQHKLQAREPMADIITRISEVISHAVTSDDELVGSAEGLQCLVLLGFQQANSGNLRKAWLSFRRALNIAQLLGLERGDGKNLKSCDPSVITSKTAAEALWYRIMYSDRYLSLLLGLPIGTQDESFATPLFAGRDTPMERLEKQHTLLSGRIVARNHSKPAEAYEATVAIDFSLDKAAAEMGSFWWDEPNPDPFAPPEEMSALMHKMILQIHHFTLSILLHLPYMLRDPADQRYAHNKAAALRSSRQILTRFIMFRKIVSSAYSCRHVDYAALIAGMTLLLGYLSQAPVVESFEQERLDDKNLVEQVKERMEHVAVLNNDRLSRESAEIIGRLLPILDLATCNTTPATSGETRSTSLHLNIPYIGTVNIHRGGGDSPAPDRQLAGAAPGTSPIFTTGPSEGVGEIYGEAFEATITDLVAERMAASGFPVPDMMAESEDWAFQGVDTTYWSLLREGMDSGL